MSLKLYQDNLVVSGLLQLNIVIPNHASLIDAKIYSKHTRESAISFIDYVISRFPFRMHTARTDNGKSFKQNSIGI